MCVAKDLIGLYYRGSVALGMLVVAYLLMLLYLVFSWIEKGGYAMQVRAFRVLLQNNFLRNTRFGRLLEFPLSQFFSLLLNTFGIVMTEV